MSGVVWLWEICRGANIVLPALVGMFLGYRSWMSWVPEWIPQQRYRRHYRFLLVTMLIFVLMVTVATRVAIQSDVAPGPVSAVYTALCLGVLMECLLWPRNKEPRHEE